MHLISFKYLSLKLCAQTAEHLWAHALDCWALQCSNQLTGHKSNSSDSSGSAEPSCFHELEQQGSTVVDHRLLQVKETCRAYKL
jgi:hypothetical protein